MEHRGQSPPGHRPRRWIRISLPLPPSLRKRLVHGPQIQCYLKEAGLEAIATATPITAARSSTAPIFTHATASSWPAHPIPEFGLGHLKQFGPPSDYARITQLAEE